MKVRVARVLTSTVAEGPGARTAVWFQGCSIRCRGCINPHLFRADGGVLMDTDEIVEFAVAAGDEGLTLIGGEPFDQAPAATVLARDARAQGLGTICFTGYEYEALQARGEDARQLIEQVDLLVDGPYIAELAEDTRPLVGSTNQRLIHLTERYRSAITLRRNRIEMRVDAAGHIDVAGFTDSQGLASLQRALGRRQLRRRPYERLDPEN